MTDTVRNNLTITGNGSSTGGVYRDVKIMGDARIDGDLDSLGFKCTGTAQITGNLKSTSCTIMGTVDVKGNLDTGEAKITGTLQVDGNVKTQAMKTIGETHIRGSIAGEDVSLEGLFHIKNNCEAETLRMKGVYTIDGLLNAGMVELKVYSKCKVKEIGGEKIDIRRGTSSVFKKLVGLFYLPSDYFEGTLQVDTIEGDDIYVEHTSATVIRGNNVIIGPGCSIKTVEYTSSFHKAEDSAVSSHSQV